MGRFIISEEEKKHILGLYNLVEQKPDYLVDRQSAALMSTSDENYIKRMRDIDEYKSKASTMSVEELIDNSINVISAVFDGIPGLGNLISAGIDITHSLSYFARGYFSTDKKYKAEMYYSGIVQGILAFVPFIGNIISAGFSVTLKQYMRMTHSDILNILKRLGINIRVFPLEKNSFVFNWMAALISYLTSYATDINVIQACTDYLKQAQKYINEIISNITLPQYSILPHFSEYSDIFKDVLEFIGLGLSDIENAEKFETECNSPEDVGEYEGIVIVGTYGDYDNLIKRENEMKGKGYKIYNQCLDNGSTRLGVRVKYSDANDFETKFNKVKEFQSNAWVLKFSDTAIGIKMTNQFKNLMKYITGN